MKPIIKKLWIFIVLLGISASAVAQAPKFIVYFAAGKCSKIVAGKSSPLKKGDKLQSADQVIIGKAGKAILICSNFNTRQLTTAKTYKVADLYKETIKEPASFTASYFHFIWDEFSHPHGSPEKEPEKYMKTAGAVTRGKEPVQLFAPLDTIKYFNGPLAIRFQSVNDSATFTLHRVEGRKLTIVNTGKYTGKIPVSNFLTGSAEAHYQWQLAEAKNPRMKGAVHTILVYKEEDYRKNVAALLKGIIDSDEAETAFMKAFILEKHQYVAEAAKYYQQALKLKPSSPVYKAFAERF